MILQTLLKNISSSIQNEISLLGFSAWDKFLEEMKNAQECLAKSKAFAITKHADVVSSGIKFSQEEQPKQEKSTSQVNEVILGVCSKNMWYNGRLYVYEI